jgi:hypothetical protein
MALSELGELLQRYVPLQSLRGAETRKRSWPPLVTACAFLRQVLNPGQPCRETVRASNIARLSSRQRPVSDNTSAYCQARRRLPEPLLQQLWEPLAQRLEAAVPAAHRWHGLRVGVVDGTGLSMPDTFANQRLYPQPSAQKPGCGFPVIKLVALFSLATGAIHAFAKGGLRKDHERTLFHELWHVIVKGFQLLLGDRGFCAFADMYLLKQQGVDSAFRLHQARLVNWRKGKRLGKHDRLTEWRKPHKRPQWLSLQQFEALPKLWTVRILKFQIPVRGFRTRIIILATTLLDPIAFPAAEIAELYGLRWSVELFLRHNKTTLRMDVLRCLSPEMIHREIHTHWIAYNLIRALMFEAAQTMKVSVSRISFKGALDTVRQWLPSLHAAATHPNIFRHLYRCLLRTLAKDLVPLRPNRSEPRAVKRRPKKFHLLNKPRHLMGNLPHLNRPSTAPKQHA